MLKKLICAIKFIRKTEKRWYIGKIMCSNKSFQIKFGGDNTGIDADFFASTIKNLSILVNSAQAEIGSDTRAKLTITQTSPGSFCVDFSLFIDAVAPILLLANQSIDASQIVKTIMDFVGFIKGLKGKKPQTITPTGDGAQYVVINGDGNTVNITNSVHKMYVNPAAQSAAIKMVQEFGKSGRASLEFNDGSSEVSLTPEDVPNIKPDIFEISDEVKVSKVIMVLPIRRPDLTGNGKWLMKYGEQFETMTITDKSFLEKVHAGNLTFAAGDQIECQLRIDYKDDADGYPVPGTQKFFIEKVIRKIDQPLQTNINI